MGRENEYTFISRQGFDQANSFVGHSGQQSDFAPVPNPDAVENGAWSRKRTVRDEDDAQTQSQGRLNDIPGATSEQVGGGYGEAAENVRPGKRVRTGHKTVIDTARRGLDAEADQSRGNVAQRVQAQLRARKKDRSRPNRSLKGGRSAPPLDLMQKQPSLADQQFSNGDERKEAIDFTDSDSTQDSDVEYEEDAEIARQQKGTPPTSSPHEEEGAVEEETPVRKRDRATREPLVEAQRSAQSTNTASSAGTFGARARDTGTDNLSQEEGLAKYPPELAQLLMHRKRNREPIGEDAEPLWEEVGHQTKRPKMLGDGEGMFDDPERPSYMFDNNQRKPIEESQATQDVEEDDEDDMEIRPNRGRRRNGNASSRGRDSQNLNPDARRRHCHDRGRGQTTAYVQQQATQDFPNGEPCLGQREEAVDFRGVDPASEAESQTLDEALQFTRDAFFEWTGYDAPITDRRKSYFYQWEQLHLAFDDYDWSAEKDGATPYLYQSLPWYTSFDHWSVPQKDSVYYEAWKLGARAPRGFNGQVLDPLPGWFLESIGKLEDGERQRKLDRAMGSQSSLRRLPGAPLPSDAKPSQCRTQDFGNLSFILYLIPSLSIQLCFATLAPDI